MEEILKRLLESKKELVVTPTYIRGVVVKIEVIGIKTNLIIDATYIGSICDVVIRHLLDEKMTESITGLTLKEFEQILEVEHI